LRWEYHDRRRPAPPVLAPRRPPPAFSSHETARSRAQLAQPTCRLRSQLALAPAGKPIPGARAPPRIDTASADPFSNCPHERNLVRGGPRSRPPSPGPAP
jgi:hypothetical protein